MSTSKSKLTAQGQISVPAEIRRKLGVGPGSVLEWHDTDEGVTVRRAGRFDSVDVHAVLFPAGVPTTSGPVDVKRTIRARMRRRHAGG